MKWFFIRKSKPQNKYEIVFNCMFISVMFMALENSAFMLSYSSNLLGVYRAFLPVHLLCQLIMALFMLYLFNKAEEKNNIFIKVMSLLFPIIFHTLYNTIVSFSGLIINFKGVEIQPILVILGLILYIFILVLLKKYQDENKNFEQFSQRKIVMQIIVIIILFIIWSLLFFCDNNVGIYLSN